MPSPRCIVRGMVSLPYSYVTEKKFRDLCRIYPDTPLEKASNGRLITLPSVDSDASRINVKITARLGEWADGDKSGIGFGSRTGFAFPNGAILAPCLSWVRTERWTALSREQQEDFAPISPDFVLEYLPPRDDLKRLRAKMREYRDNGTRLGWLFNLPRHRVEIYRPRQRVETLQSPLTLSGEDFLPGFVLDLTEIWA